MKFTERLSHGLTLLAFYTRSKLLTNDDVAPIDLGEGAGTIQNPLNRRGEYSVSQDDYPNAFRVTFTYQLPFRPRRALFESGGGWAASSAAGNWQVPSSRQSGPPFPSAVTPVFRSSAIRRCAPVMCPVRTCMEAIGSFDPAVVGYLSCTALCQSGCFPVGRRLPRAELGAPGRPQTAKPCLCRKASALRNG